VFVVGPSGAGKETLLRLARAALADHHDIVFQRRVVTRRSGLWEDHDSLTAEEFAAARERGAFALSWSAHGLDYGIPREANELVRRGRIVVCSVSRGVAADAKARLAGAGIVYITAPFEVRAKRLSARGRETVIAGRMERDVGDGVRTAADLVIDNSGAPEQGGAQLTAYLSGLIGVQMG
jgi:ribose 1,5-bisphosphokinase